MSPGIASGISPGLPLKIYSGILSESPGILTKVFLGTPPEVFLGIPLGASAGNPVRIILWIRPGFFFSEMSGTLLGDFAWISPGISSDVP